MQNSKFCNITQPYIFFCGAVKKVFAKFVCILQFWSFFSAEWCQYMQYEFPTNIYKYKYNQSWTKMNQTIERIENKEFSELKLTLVNPAYWNDLVFYFNLLNHGSN